MLATPTVMRLRSLRGAAAELPALAASRPVLTPRIASSGVGGGNALGVGGNAMGGPPRGGGGADFGGGGGGAAAAAAAYGAAAAAELSVLGVLLRALRYPGSDEVGSSVTWHVLIRSLNHSE